MEILSFLIVFTPFAIILYFVIAKKAGEKRNELLYEHWKNEREIKDRELEERRKKDRALMLQRQEEKRKEELKKAREEAEKRMEEEARQRRAERERQKWVSEQISKLDIEKLTVDWQNDYIDTVYENIKLTEDDVISRGARRLFWFFRDNKIFPENDMSVSYSYQQATAREAAKLILYNLVNVGVLVKKPVRDKDGRLKGYYIRKGKGQYTYHPKAASGGSLPAKGIDVVDKMDGHKFEEYCADLLRKTGYTNVEVTKGSGDQGVDVIATKDGVKYAIQCKCYSSDLGNTPVQEVNAGKALYKCHVGAVLTNRYFTAGAKELAEATGVLLWDRDELMRMIAKAEK